MALRIGPPLSIAVALLALAGCGGDDGPPSDGGFDGGLDGGTEPDARIDGPLRLEGPAVAFVGEEACFTVSPPTTAVTFFWGDGERSEGGPEACHAFAYPGAFVVSAETPTETASRTIRAVFTPAERRPTASSPLAFDPEVAALWVVTPDADSIARIDAESLERTALIATCARPRTLALGTTHLAVACQDGDALALHDRATGVLAMEVSLPVGARPFGVVVDPRDGERFVVVLQDLGALAIVEGGALTQTVAVGDDLRALTMNDQGLVLVTRWRAAASGATLHAVDLSDPTSPEVLPAGLLPRQEGLDSDTDNSGVPSFLDAVAFTPEGLRALLPALKANNVTGLHRTGHPMDSQTTARAILVEAFADPFADSEVVEETWRHSFDDLDYASALVPSALGDVLYVTLYGAQRVVAVDAFTFDVVGSIASVGIGPRGVALDGSGERLFVWAELDRSVRAYDIRDLSAEPPLLATIPTIDTEPLDPQVLRGKQVFSTAVDPRMSRTSYLSCASCHLDGEGDNLVWDFTQRGEGLRNTIALHGSAQSFPLHWSGNFDEVQDFEADIRLHQGGTGFLAESDWAALADPLGAPKAGASEELDALAAYVASLTTVGVSPFRRSDAEFGAKRAEGAALFVAAGCATCHAGPLFADGLRHDVGTLGAGSGQRLGGELDGLDTPTLIGLWRTAPYLHDGSAETLREVLTTRNVADAHGATSTLGDADLDALELYLLTLDDAR